MEKDRSECCRAGWSRGRETRELGMNKEEITVNGQTDFFLPLWTI